MLQQWNATSVAQVPIDFDGGVNVISKNLSKTVALQALYRIYFLLEVRIMCLFNEN